MNGIGIESGKELTASEVAQPVCVKPSEPLSTYTPTAPRVYLDESEFYVSSDEVRIGEKKWKLADVEYVSVEYYKGWLKKLLACVFLGFLICFLFFIWSSERNIFIPMLILPLLIPFCWDILDYIKRLIPLKDKTGFLRVNVYLRNNTTFTQILNLGNNTATHLFQLSEQFSKAVQYNASLNHLYNRLFKEKQTDDVESVFLVDTPEVALNEGAIRLYNIEWQLVDIEKVEYRNGVPTLTTWIMAILSIVSFAVFLTILLTKEGQMHALTYIPALISFIARDQITSSYRRLTIHFTDGAIRIIKKFPDDDRNENLKYFYELMNDRIEKRNLQI